VTEPTPQAPSESPRPPGENAARVLDLYADQVLSASTVSHRESPLLADTLIRSLLRDLTSYAAAHGVDFVSALAEALEHQPAASAGRAAAGETTSHTSPNWLRVGSEVRIRPSAVVGSPNSRSLRAQGFIAAISSPDPGESAPQRFAARGQPSGTDEPQPDATCTVRFPGVGDYILAARSLEPAKPFPSIRLKTVTAVNAADAEATLITTAARILRDQQLGMPRDSDAVADRDHLAGALGVWAGSTGERVLFALGTRIGRAASRMDASPEHFRSSSKDTDRLAGEDFPHEVTNAITASKPSDAQQPSSTHPAPSRGSAPGPKGGRR
jgi:hypothetical protein